jgi:hypothetical protein
MQPKKYCEFLGEILSISQGPSQMYSDNQGAIVLAQNNKYHACSKHIDIHHHFIHQVLEKQNIDLTYVPTKQNVADIFTKALLTPISKNCWDYALLEGECWNNKCGFVHLGFFPVMVICG